MKSPPTTLWTPPFQNPSILITIHKADLPVNRLLNPPELDRLVKAADMSSIGKITASAVTLPTELTVAAAAFNIDFLLLKVEAPIEFNGFRTALSSWRIKDAEGGQHRIAARQLGALFEAELPPIPQLI